MNTQLLCLFTYRNELDTSLEFVLKNYTLINPNIFVLESKNTENDLFITYNVEKGSAPIDSQWKTILVHRKKQTNTLYTINALNQLVMEKTGGMLDDKYEVDWEEYRNCILLTNAEGVRKITTRVFDVIEIEGVQIN